MPYANREDLNQFSDPCSLIKAFPVRQRFLLYMLILLAGNGGSDQTARMRSLIRAIVSRLA